MVMRLRHDVFNAYVTVWPIFGQDTNFTMQHEGCAYDNYEYE